MRCSVPHRVRDRGVRIMFVALFRPAGRTRSKVMSRDTLHVQTRCRSARHAGCCSDRALNPFWCQLPLQMLLKIRGICYLALRR